MEWSPARRGEYEALGKRQPPYTQQILLTPAFFKMQYSPTSIFKVTLACTQIVYNTTTMIQTRDNYYRSVLERQ